MATYRIRLAPVMVLSEHGPELIEPPTTLEIVGDSMGLFPAVEGDYYQIKRDKITVFLCAANLVSYCQQLVTETAQVVALVTEGENRG